MPAAVFVVRSTVDDPAKRTAFDKWYQNELLPVNFLPRQKGVAVLEPDRSSYSSGDLLF
jgi:hypothetical protein